MSLKKILLIPLFLITIILPVWSQNQPDIPKPRGPVDLSDTSNLILFIIIPAIIIVAYLFFRKKINRIKKEQRESEAKKDQ